MNIVITGASKGIGLAIAKRFSADADAHRFMLCARTADELEAATETLRVQNPQHHYHSMVCDVADQKQVLAIAERTNELFSSTDILVNNAGFGLFKSVEECSAEEFRSVLAANVRGVFLMCREFLPPMRTKRSGSIVTIASLAGKNGFPTGGAYCASKYAVRGLMQCLFLEVRADNIRCLTINPGSVDTAFFDEIAHPGNTLAMLHADEVAEVVYHSTKLPIGATVSEIDIGPTNPKAK